jgi:hypothetical protein
MSLPPAAVWAAESGIGWPASNRVLVTVMSLMPAAVPRPAAETLHL